MPTYERNFSKNILSSLWYENYEVIIDDIAKRALDSVNRMINL